MISLTPDQLVALSTPLLLVVANDGKLRPSTLRLIEERDAVPLVKAGMLYPREKSAHPRARAITPAGRVVVDVAREIKRRGLVVQTAIETYKDGSFSVVVMFDGLASVIANGAGYGVAAIEGVAGSLTSRLLSTHEHVDDAFGAALAYLAPLQAEFVKRAADAAAAQEQRT